MKFLSVAVIFSALVLGQEASAPISISFSDAARPKRLTANLMNGSLTVSGYAGKDVQIEVRGGSHGNRHVPRGAEGLKRVDVGGGDVTAEEENNTVRVHGPMNGSLVIRVPYDTSLKLECMNGGDLKVDHVSGNLELSNLNGEVSATNVSGTVVAHSMNGKVLVTFDKIVPDKVMSFSTMNGDVDVTLPGDSKATLKMKSDNGDVFTDFDLKLSGTANAPVVEDGRAKGGKYKVKVDRTTAGTINGGGPEMTFKTFNGNIYLRQKK